MFGDGALAFREFTMKEPVPLAVIQAAILDLLRSRKDAVLFGAQAVNAYCDEPRMTQGVDILSSNARALADAIRDEITKKFHLAIRVRELASGRDYRVFQVRKPSNRHLADIRSVEVLPPAKRIGGVRVVTVPELIARKLLAYRRRKGQPKSGTDWRDLAMLLLAYPELKTGAGDVADRLSALGATQEDMKTWSTLVQEPIQAGVDEENGP